MGRDSDLPPRDVEPGDAAAHAGDAAAHIRMRGDHWLIGTADRWTGPVKAGRRTPSRAGTA